MKARLDAMTGLAGLGMVLTLGGATILAPRGATARTAPPTPNPRGAEVRSTPATAPGAQGGGVMAGGLADDGDGDELLEHWGDPKFSREERVQLGGLMVVFGVVGMVAYRRRAVLRRPYGER